MSKLHLVRLRFDMPRLYELAKRRNLPLRDVDLGYLVHAQLWELIREAPPTLFALPMLNRPVNRSEGKPRVSDGALEVVAYSRDPGAKLLERARSFAGPEHWNVLLDERIDSKEMPASFPKGTEVGFELRACPVIRTKRKRDGTQTKSGDREIDAFLLEVEKHPETKLGTLNKKEIYKDWLRARFNSESGATLEAVELVAIRRERVSRRGKGDERPVRAFDRPDVVFHGRLRVTDSDKFEALLAHGIGRHRAFGFGMLLLRPPA